MKKVPNMDKSANSSDLSTSKEEAETPIRLLIPTAKQGGKLISQENNEDTSFQEYDGKRAIKGILVAIPVSFVFWCIIVSILYIFWDANIIL